MIGNKGFKCGVSGFLKLKIKKYMENLLKKVAMCAVVGVLTLSVAAREKGGIRLNVSGDFVSSYVWRGIYQGAQACIQPTLGLGTGGFSFTVWGSTSLADIGNGHKELDLTAAYSLGCLTVQVADLWWGGQGNKHYFHYENRETDHHFEAGLTYTLSGERIPLSMAWYTVFAGNDEDTNGKRQYSSYVEVNYPFSVKGIGLNATLGFVPYKSMSAGMGYMTKSFSVTNIALKATREIKLSQAFSLPFYAQVICNPRTEDTHLVLGFTIQ